MEQTLREFISAREIEVRKQIKAPNSELREISDAKTIVWGHGKTTQAGARYGNKTQRDMVIDVLKEASVGLSHDEVIADVKDGFGVEIPKPSMAAQLSRARAEGLVTRDKTNKTWLSEKLSNRADRREENEASSEASETRARSVHPLPTL